MKLNPTEFDDFDENGSFVDEFDDYERIDIDIMTKEYDENYELKNYMESFDKSVFSMH